MLRHLNADCAAIGKNNPIVIPHWLSSARKKMSTIVACDRFYRAFVKGTPDFVLRGSTHYLAKDGTRMPLTQEIRDGITQKIVDFSDLALRTLLICYRDFSTTEPEHAWDDAENVEQDLTVIALVGIEDPLRPEVIEAIRKCDQAGVTVRMVTGDYLNTAKAIAKQCGIVKDDDAIVMRGEEFAAKSKSELIDILPKLRVLAMSSPRDKLRLVSLLMEAGEVVAVTGDGSNDSPALRKANVGLSMGQCGTELARLASDIVILDDNFNSIVSALKWGRCVYDNVRGFLQFELTGAFSAITVALVGSCVLRESPLKPIQVLWVNLVINSLGALALATRRPSDALLLRPPYGEADKLISNVLLRNIVGHCVYQVIVLCLILFGGELVFGIHEIDGESQRRHVATLLFNSLVYMQAFNLINARVAGQDMSVLDGLFSNSWFIGIFFGIAGLQAMLTELLRPMFHTVSMTATEWLICLAFGAGSLVVGIILRLIRLSDQTSERVEAFRTMRVAAIKKFYEEVPGDKQWEMNSLDDSSEPIVVEA
jgi:Ca2+-transporting ATPase